MFTGEIRRARSKRPLVIAVTFAVVVVAIVLLVPLPHPLPSTYTLLPAATLDVTAPRDAVVTEVSTADASQVGKGMVLAKFDVSDAEKRLPEAKALLADLEERKAGKKKPTAAQLTAVKKAEAARVAASVAVEKLEKKGVTGAKLNGAKTKLELSEQALEKAKLALGPAANQLDAALEAAKQDVATLEAQLAAPTLLASGSGLLELKGLTKGQHVKAGEVLAVIKDVAKLKAQVKVPAGEAIVKGQAVELTLEGSKKRFVFEGPAMGDLAWAEVDNKAGAWRPGMSGEAVIDGTQRSLLSTWTQ